MERTQQRVMGVFMAFALVLGFALAFGMPQQAEAKTVQLKAGQVGTTFERATNITLQATKNNTNPSQKIMTTFNTNNDNNFYKFTTSDRDSTYELKFQQYNYNKNSDYFDIIYVTVYDSSHHRFYSSAVDKNSWKKTFTIPLERLKRNQVYYVEVWRYAIDYPQYGGQAAYAKYAMTLTEQIAKPAAIKNLKVKKTQSKRFTATYSKIFNADGYQIQFKRAWTPKTPVTQNRYTTGAKASYKTLYTISAQHNYNVRVRPYRLVDGYKFFGPWNKVKNAKTGKYKAGYVKVIK